MEAHEDPYMVAGNAAPLEPGHAFSVEPGVYLPGRFGLRLEDIVVATTDGPQRLDERARDPPSWADPLLPCASSSRPCCCSGPPAACCSGG